MSNEQFGTTTDHFGLTDSGGALSGKVTLVDSSKTPTAQDRADANDELGDIVASAYYGNTDGNLYEISTTYQLKCGETLDLGTLQLGELSSGSGTGAGIIANDVTVDTSNGDALPTISVSGIEGVDCIDSGTGINNTFTLPSITIEGEMKAQTMQFTVDSGRLTSSSFTASIDIADQADGEGEIIAHGVSGGTMEVSADIVSISSAPAWSFESGSDFTVTQEPSDEESQADWATGSGTAAGTLTRD